MSRRAERANTAAQPPVARPHSLCGEGPPREGMGRVRGTLAKSARATLTRVETRRRATYREVKFVSAANSVGTVPVSCESESNLPEASAGHGGGERARELLSEARKTAAQPAAA